MSSSNVMISSACLLLLLASSAVHAQECSFVSQRVQCGELTCNRSSHQCVPCVNTSQCYEKSVGCVNNQCVILPIKDVFGPMIIVAPLAAFLVCAIAVVAGVGGGGILVPLFFAALNVPLLNAVALSQATIAGQSFFNVCLLLPRKHPKHQSPEPTRPVINYEYLCLILPISLVGVLLGNLASQVSPNWLRIVLLYTLLSYILYRVVRRLLNQRKEDMEKKALIKRQESERLERMKTDPYGSVNMPPPKEPEGELLPQFPAMWLGFVFVTFALLFGSNLLRGKFLDLVECGSYGYWSMVGGVVVYSTVLYLIVYYVLRKRLQRAADGEVDPGTIPFKWNKLTTIVFPIVAVFAGAAASMLGIGGGLVLSFLLYEAGLVPEEASATSGVATFIVATSSAAQFILQKALPWDYGLMMFGAGIASTFVGQFVFNRQIKKHGWTFLILGSLAFVLAGSMVALTAVGIYNTYETVEHHGSLGFGTLCKPVHAVPHHVGMYY